MPTIILASNTSWSLYNYRKGLIQALLKRGYSVFAVAPKDSFSTKLGDIGCEVVDIQIDAQGVNPWRDLRTLFAFYSTYKRVKPDFVLHFTIKPVIYGSIASRWLGIPCVNTITGLGSVFMNGNWVAKMVAFLYRISLRYSRTTIFQNPDDLRLFVGRGFVRKERALFFPGSGVNLAHFFPQPPNNRESFVFILIARMLLDKGIGVYVDAAREVKRRHPGAKFYLLGPLDDEKERAVDKAQLDSWVGEGVVEYLGAKDDVRPQISESDCVVLPSYYKEGAPRCLMEAAAMARPIITTDNVGCREVVDDGETGYLCKANNEADLVDKMERMLKLSNHERAEMGRKGREKMEREFDEQIVIKGYLELLTRN